ncbi:MAG: hypothetical protein ACOC7X_11295 [Spirochaetota bacterium]
MYKITIFHYHLLTGGITQVISSSVKALLHTAADQFDITIVCGRDTHRLQLIDSLNREVKNAGIDAEVKSEHMPEIDYLVEQSPHPSVKDIRRHLTERFSGSTWWVHNYHIGKNPLFTEALVQIAREQPQQQIVLHIHDFPESGRFSNLKALYESLNSPLYPTGENVRYVLINSRDRDILAEAGIPEEQLFLLNNPIEAKQEKRIDYWDVQQKISSWASEHSMRWEPGGKLLLYPVRTIRRKNVLEAGLLVNLLESPANLLVTLPGVSKQEIAYSNLLEAAFQNRLISGSWGIGTHLDEIGVSFTELSRSADTIISTAIQEGFGFLFINSILWGVPLIARDLDILGGIRDSFHPDSSLFYESLQVPLTTGDRAALGDAYTKLINTVAPLLPDEQDKRLHYEVEQLLAEELIDYSFLTVDQQYEFLKRSAESQEFVNELREINAETVATAENLLRGPKVRNREHIIEEFGATAHTRSIQKILDSFENLLNNKSSSSGAIADDPVHQKVLQAFNHLAYLRPLFF